MKRGERTSTEVLAAYVEAQDPGFKTRHPEFNPALPLSIDLELKGLCAI